MIAPQRTVLTGVPLITILLFMCCSALAQTPGGSATDAGMVILNVRVTDRESQAVIDVGRDAFSVMEDGAPQKITSFPKKKFQSVMV